MEEASNFCPAIAVPTTVKMPEPITAPMPSAVRLSHPRDFFNRRSGSSASDINWSIFLTRNSPEPNGHHPFEWHQQASGELYLAVLRSATLGNVPQKVNLSALILSTNLHMKFSWLPLIKPLCWLV